MGELYEVLIDGQSVTEPVNRKGALSIVIAALDSSVPAHEVLVLEAERLEPRARWRRCGLGWTVRSVRAWLS